MPRSATSSGHCRSRPGVYRMQDARGDVLYVGKARTLRSRVTSYTQVPRLTKRLQRMVSQTRSMTIVTTRTEAEALLLEAQLIKRFRPPYNVLLRDDKSFPFILLREDHAFPRVQKHRGARRIKGQYYGPFASAGSVTRTLNALQKLFLLRSCSDSFFANRSRPCLLYQIKRCSAPCVGRIDERGLWRAGRRRQGVPRGQVDRGAGAVVQVDGRSRRAPRFRACRGLSRPAARADLHPGQPDGPRRGARRRRRVRAGVQGRERCRSRPSSSAAGRIGAIAPSSRRTPTTCRRPRCCRASSSSSTRTCRRQSGSWSTATCPSAKCSRRRCQREGRSARSRSSSRSAGRGRKLVEQASAQCRRSARPAAWPRRRPRRKVLRELADTFELAEVPKRIEVYDNSHIMGTNATGAMVVAGPEGFRKNNYRKFNIKRARDRTGRRFRDDARSARAAFRAARKGRSRPRPAANGPTSS